MARKGGFPGGMMPGNMNNMLKQVQKMQKDMEKMQAELEEKEVEASVGGGAVKVVANGKKQIISIEIKPEVVDPEDIEMLQDLVLSAVNEALRSADEMSAGKMAQLTGGINEYPGTILMQHYSNHIDQLIERLGKLPGIGYKTAQRLAFYIINMPKDEVIGLANAMQNAKEHITYCEVCYNISDANPCSICDSKTRDSATICVVEDPRDVAAMERTREYHGKYHVLHGTISPSQAITPDMIRIKELMSRLHDPEIKEIIIATNTTIDGEATAMYLARLIKPFGIKVTRIAHGLPVGANLEFADDVTIGRALEGRREL